MTLAEWARANGVAPRTARRQFQAGLLPVKAHQVSARMIMVGPAPTEQPLPVGSIPLRDRYGRLMAVTTVDAADHEWLASWQWCRHTGYAARRTPAGLMLMHRQILGLEIGDRLEGDHRDRDRLNNRRGNLRVVTTAQQQQNLPAMGGRSRFRGVAWDEANKKWRATVNFEGKQHSCGRHRTELEAALAAERFRLEHMRFATPDPALEGHVWRQV